MERYCHSQRMGNNTVLNLELDAAEANLIREKNEKLKNVLAPQVGKKVIEGW